jgi:hypothetical protein
MAGQKGLGASPPFHQRPAGSRTVRARFAHHDDQHFELAGGVHGVGDAGGHEHGLLAGLGWDLLAADDRLDVAVEGLHDGVE